MATEPADRDHLRVMPNDPRHAAASRSEQIWAAQAEAQRLHRRRLSAPLDSETRHEAKQRRASKELRRDMRVEMETRMYLCKISG